MAIISVIVSLALSSSEVDYKSEISDAEIKEINDFISNLKEERYQDSIKRFRRYKNYREDIVLEPFDPNIADSLSFRHLGIPAYVVRNILKYRKTGGKFKDAAAFSKIYGLKPELFEVLKPFIAISSELFTKKDTFHIRKRDSLEVFKFKEIRQVDLNSADTLLLKKIPGIGSGIARMIIAYRSKLGGFYSVGQLGEIGYIDDKLFEWFAVITPIDDKNKIKVNSSSLDRLRNHPYMNFYKAKVIIEYRRKRGKIKDLSQLALFEEFTEKDLNRLSNYLDFN